jgi:hypothetical protein
LSAGPVNGSGICDVLMSSHSQKGENVVCWSVGPSSWGISPDKTDSGTITEIVHQLIEALLCHRIALLMEISSVRKKLGMRHRTTSQRTRNN